MFLQFFESVERSLGSVDILVVNGGGPRPGTFAQMPEPEWDAAYGAREVESAISAREAHQFAMAFIRSAILIVAKLEKVSDTA